MAQAPARSTCKNYFPGRQPCWRPDISVEKALAAEDFAPGEPIWENNKCPNSQLAGPFES